MAKLKGHFIASFQTQMETVEWVFLSKKYNTFFEKDTLTECHIQRMLSQGFRAVYVYEHPSALILSCQFMDDH